MKKFQTVFKRYEKKYVITKEKANRLVEMIEDKIAPDKYGKSTVCNIYFDTLDYRVIRHSMEKGIFKEKLRIRSYNCPDADSTVFVELKKKFDGVVYKRRVDMTYAEAVNYLIAKRRPKHPNEQVLNEIDYFLKFYPSIRPSFSIFYSRIAFYCKSDKNLRITFDSDVRFRTTDLDLAKGSYGHEILSSEKTIMEIKCASAMPLWLTNALTELEIFPTSFSKYATAFALFIGENNKETAKII